MIWRLYKSSIVTRVNQFFRLTDTRYVGALILLLGVSFQLSMAATNILFYLLVISSIAMTVQDKVQGWQHWRTIIRSPLWWWVSAWVGLLYISISYSEFNELLGGYAKKYLKYALLGFIAVLILSKRCNGVDLPKRFFIGFALGGIITFMLGGVNKTTGWLTLAATQGWVSEKYVQSGYWISNELFAHSLFMAVLFTYGLTAWLQVRRSGYLLFCLIGLFGVFIVSEQRTGFIVTLVVTVWLLGLFLPTAKQKLMAVIVILGLIVTLLLTDNPVSVRIFEFSQEWQACYLRLDDIERDIQSFGEACRNSAGLRFLFLRDSISQISEAWFLGHGMGNLQVVTINYDWVQGQYSIGTSDNPHNEYLLQGIQLGIVGVLLLLAILATAFYQAMQLNRNRRYLYAGIILMYAVGCLFNSFLLDAMQGLLFTLVIAFIMVERVFQQEETCSYR